MDQQAKNRHTPYYSIIRMIESMLTTLIEPPQPCTKCDKEVHPRNGLKATHLALVFEWFATPDKMPCLCLPCIMVESYSGAINCDDTDHQPGDGGEEEAEEN
ncbi:hypothetical protein P152DRAFT_460167, partial [Eremomyces bilateralis CBS 781.70]